MSEITVEQAWAVINAHHDAEDARREEESRELIGRCFKVDAALEDFVGEKVWRCIKVTAVDRGGILVGTVVQVRLRHGANA